MKTAVFLDVDGRWCESTVDRLEKCSGRRRPVEKCSGRRRPGENSSMVDIYRLKSAIFTDKVPYVGAPFTQIWGVSLYAGHLFWTFFSTKFEGSAYMWVGLYASIYSSFDKRKTPCGEGSKTWDHAYVSLWVLFHSPLSLHIHTHHQPFMSFMPLLPITGLKLLLDSHKFVVIH